MAGEQEQPMDKRIPLVVMPENRDSSTAKDARLVNCYMEAGAQKGEVHIYKRAGTALNVNPSGTGAHAGYGCYNWKGDVYSIFDATLYKNSSIVGTVDSTNGVYQFNQSLGSPTMLVFGNGTASYTYDGTTLLQMVTLGTTLTDGVNAFVVGHWYSIVTKGTSDFTTIGSSTNTPGCVFKATGTTAGGNGTIVESAFPATVVKGFAYLDETTYVMTSQAVIQGSGVLGIGTQGNIPAYWSALNALTAQIEPDGGIAIAKQLVYVVALKQWSTEIFYDAANPTGSPLSTVQGAKVNYGCVSANSVQDVDGKLFWLANNRNSNPQVVMLSALSCEVISTKSVDKLLTSVNASSTIYSFSFKDGGHQFYILTIVQLNLTLAYDVAEKMWSQWADVNGNYLPFVACTFDSNNNRLWQHATNGNLYYASKSYLNDAGTIITADIYTPNFDGGTSKIKHLNRLFFVGDQVAGSILNVRCSDDDYQTWTNFRNVNMSVKRPYLDRCGSFYKRAYHIRHAKNTAFRLSALEHQISLGTL